MSNHIITLLLLITAVACYALGMVIPATILLVLGAVAEIAFWYRLFIMGRESNPKHQAR